MKPNLIIFLGLTLSLYESVIAPPLLADNYRGFSSFASLSPRYPCSRLLQTLEAVPKPAINFVYGTFGNDFSCIKRFIDEFKDKDKAIQGQLSNENCRKYRRCGKGELFGKWSVRRYNYKLRRESKILSRHVGSRIRKIRRATETSGPNSLLVLSTGLEDQLTNISYLKLYDVIRETWPYEISRNPLKGHYIGPADYLERHGLRPEFHGKPCIYNNDGTEIDIPKAKHVLKRYSHCRVSYFWNKRSQGRDTDEFVDPRLRRFRIFIKDIYLIGILLGGVYVRGN